MEIIKTEEEFQAKIKDYIDQRYLASTSFELLKRSTTPEKLLGDKSEDLRYRKIVVDVSRDPVDDLYNFKANIYNKQVIMSYDSICMDYYIDEKIIRRNIEFFNGKLLSETQKLSEEFIEEFQDLLDWGVILLSQDLSTKFLEKHKDKIRHHFEFQSLASYEADQLKKQQDEEILIDREPGLREEEEPVQAGANPALQELVNQLRELTEEEGLNNRLREEKKLKNRIIIYRVIMGLLALMISFSLYTSVVNVDEHFSIKEKSESTIKIKPSPIKSEEKLIPPLKNDDK